MARASSVARIRKSSVHVGRRQRGDDRAAPRVHLDQAFSLELAQRLAQRGATDAELVGELIFEEALAGRQGAVADELPKSTIGDLTEPSDGRVGDRWRAAAWCSSVCIMLYTTRGGGCSVRVGWYADGPTLSHRGGIAHARGSTNVHFEQAATSCVRSGVWPV